MLDICITVLSICLEYFIYFCRSSGLRGSPETRLMGAASSRKTMMPIRRTVGEAKQFSETILLLSESSLLFQCRLSQLCHWENLHSFDCHEQLTTTGRCTCL